MDSQKQQIVEKLQAANNILLTVSRDPSVDQLAACIALTILLNKMDKHATAVFSGKIPNTIDFLKPDETLEKNTDSLRDFIIALDKSKADKLRYKVEDRVVKIFITPYKTSLTSDDLEFSQGDFNVDVVLALGVHQQADLDDAITAHGRILHDATVMCINTTPNGDLGSVNWVGQNASSLSELATELARSFEKPQLDEQIATALLTGIVAETNRFKNDKTTANTMSLSADLMKAGANQQLVADELEQTVRVRDQKDDNDDTRSAKSDEIAPQKVQDGTLEINHPADIPTDGDDHNGELPPIVEDDNEDHTPLEDDDKLDTLDFSSRTMLPDSPEEIKPDDAVTDQFNDSPRSLITEPPTFGAPLTANTQPDNGDLTNVGMPVIEPEGPLIERENNLDKTGDNPPESNEPQAHDGPETDDMPPIPSPPSTPSKPTFEPVFTPPTPPAPTPAPSPQPSVEPPAPEPPRPPTPEPMPAPAPTFPSSPQQETLTELEEAVKSPHVEMVAPDEPAEPAASSTDEIDKARDEVMRALSEQPSSLPPIEALNAHSVELGKDAPTPELSAAPATEQPVSINPPEQAPFSTSPADKPLDMPLPPSITLPPAQTQPPTNSPSDSPDPPPQVPPPFLPGNFGK